MGDLFAHYYQVHNLDRNWRPANLEKHCFVREVDGAPWYTVFTLDGDVEPATDLPPTELCYLWSEKLAVSVSEAYVGQKPATKTAGALIRRIQAIHVNRDEWVTTGVVNTSFDRILKGKKND